MLDFDGYSGGSEGGYLTDYGRMVSYAYAQNQEGAPQGIGELLLPFVLIFAVFYFLVIRPQHTKLKQHQEMIGAVKKGDVIVTAGGVVGEVVKLLDDSEILVEIDDNVRIRVVKATVSDVRRKEAKREGQKT